jgi:hypothetical protein
VWWAGKGRSTRLWLGRSFAAVSPGGGAESVSEAGFAGTGSAMEWLRTEAGAPKTPRRWTVMLGSGLARPFVFKPPRGLKTRHELHAMANALAAEEVGRGEDVRVWLSEPDVSGHRLGVAAVAPALALIEKAATEAGARLVSVRPGWALLTDGGGEPLKPSAAGPELLIAADPDGLVALAGDPQQWVWGGAIDARAAESGGTAWRTRLAMRLQVQTPPVEYSLEGASWVLARQQGAM